MENISRELCEKYTALDQDQIEEIMTWLGELQKIADSEDCNVYIDCLSFYGKSFVVVAEAKPNKPQSLYERPIIGSIIKLYREPAVERAFSSGQPTVGVLGLEMPTTKQVVQSAYPIFYKDQVIATLIYEKVITSYLPAEREEPEEIFLEPEVLSFLEVFTDAVLLIDRKGLIAYSNTTARRVFQELGYIDSLKGMDIHNIVSFENGLIQQFQMSGHYFEARKVLIDARQGVEGVIIRDRTEQERCKAELEKAKLAGTELRHPLKNGLRLLEFADHECAEAVETEDAKAAYRKAQGRVRALRTITEIKLNNEEIGMKQMLGQIGKELLVMLSSPNSNIRIQVEGDDLHLPGDSSNAVILVIYELICNALKYAFPGRTEGNIYVRLKDEDIVYTFEVEDDGCGFDVSDGGDRSSVGLGMIQVMVRDWLNGELRIASDAHGTKATFEVIV